MGVARSKILRNTAVRKASLGVKDIQYLLNITNVHTLFLKNITQMKYTVLQQILVKM